MTRIFSQAAIAKRQNFISLSFDDHVVLKDISFALDRGEMILLTGVSGSGKSVLLRLAMALLKPDPGQVQELRRRYFKRKLRAMTSI